MDVAVAATELERLYPRIYFACHTRHVRDPASQALLSSHQVSVLDHLDEVQPTLVKDLAAHMGVTASTMSLAIDRLEAGGYVRRARDPNDGRRVGVTVTASGAAVRRANSVLDQSLVQKLLGQLEPEERRRAIEGLQLLADAAGRMGRDVRIGRAVPSSTPPEEDRK